MLVYRTAGGGGWKDRLDRPVEAVVRDVSFGLVSREKANAGYGVVIDDDGTADDAATEAERARQREERGEALAVRLRPAARGDARALQGGDRPRAAGAGEAAALVAARAGRRRRSRASGRATASRSADVSASHGLPRTRRLRPAPGPARRRHERRLHRPRVAARLRPRRRGGGDRAAARRSPARSDSRSSTRPSRTARATGSPPRRSSTRSRRCSTLEAGSRWVEIDPRIAPLPRRAGAEQALRLGVLRHAAAEHCSPRRAATA